MFNRLNPFLAKIKNRYPLTSTSAQTAVFHVILDLTNSDIHYEPGDSIAVCPENSHEDVKLTLQYLNLQTDPTTELKETLSKKVNLHSVNKKILQLLIDNHQNPQKKEKLKELLKKENKTQLKAYQAKHSLWSCLSENLEAKVDPKEIVDLLQALLPRFYSTASSMKAVGNEVHFLIALVHYTVEEQQKTGVCSHYLTKQASLEEPTIPVYLQKTKDFLLPKKASTPIIMVGPGTGVAPFKAFMQERSLDPISATNKKNWLFFGEKTKNNHYFYKDFWEDLTSANQLKLTTAFSRDQEFKIYVQDRLKEHGKEVWEWLQEGAHFYVCGDASRMAKDVDQALHTIVQNYGQFSEIEAKAYIKKMRLEKRYLKDVY